MPTLASEKSLSPAQAWDLGSNEFLFILKGFNMKAYYVVAALLLVAGTLITGCDVGTNPLLFDGSPLTAKLRVESSVGTAFDESASIKVADVLSSVDKAVDSVKVFNITLKIDSLTDGTMDTTKVSGTGQVDGHLLFTINNVPLSAFASERSIFDSTIPGGPIFDADGVSHLLDLLHQLQAGTPPASITVRASGSASSSTLHFNVKVSLYTQIYTTP